MVSVTGGFEIMETVGVCLNEEYAVVFFFAGSLSFMDVFEDIFCENFKLALPSYTMKRFFRIKYAILSSFRKVARQTLLYPFLPIIYFLFFRFVEFFVIIFCGFLSDADSICTEFNMGLDLDRFLLIYCVGAIAKFCLTFARLMVEIVKTETMNVFGYADKSYSMSYLLEGILSPVPLHQYLSFYEMDSLVQYNRDARKVIFSDNTGEKWRKLFYCTYGIVEDLFSKVVGEIDEIKQSSELSFVKRILNNKDAELFDDVYLCIMAVRVLARTIVVSKKEDDFGCVQSSDGLPQALDLFIGFQSILTEYITVSQRNDNTVSSRAVSLSTVLDESIYALVITFYQQLDYYDFPPEHAAVLKNYADFTA